MQLDEKLFKTQYVANFISTYMALNYDDDCMNGHVANREKNQPFEDAIFLAQEAWKQYLKLYN